MLHFESESALVTTSLAEIDRTIALSQSLP